MQILAEQVSVDWRNKYHAYYVGLSPWITTQSLKTYFLNLTSEKGFEVTNPNIEHALG